MLIINRSKTQLKTNIRWRNKILQMILSSQPMMELVHPS